jgi:NAD-dependent dihydropyrimidine dehydrogenase PreA subunit
MGPTVRGRSLWDAVGQHLANPASPHSAPFIFSACLSVLTVSVPGSRTAVYDGGDGKGFVVDGATCPYCGLCSNLVLRSKHDSGGVRLWWVRLFRRRREPRRIRSVGKGTYCVEKRRGEVAWGFSC